MCGRPYQSILAAYQNEIVVLRRKKPPTPYPQIAELLREKYQITTSPENIRGFITIRAKQSFKEKTCKHAWDVELESADTQPEVSLLQKQTVLHTPDITQTPDMPKPTVKVKDKPSVLDESESLPEFEYPFSETNNLRPLPPEEAAALRKKYGLE